MAQETRRLTPATLLVALALAAFATATVTITNITEWNVRAYHPPIVKVVGSDASYTINITEKPTITVTTSTIDGTNRTIITIYGFTGDPTNYSSVIKICNKDTKNSYNVRLVYKGVIGGSWAYVKYLRLQLGANGPTLPIDGTTTPGASSEPISISSNSCVDVSAEVLVDASASTDTELLAVEVDVVSTYSP